MPNPKIKELFFSDLVYHLLITQDIHKLVHYLEKKHNSNNFKIKVPFSNQKIFIFQDRDLVSQVLKKQTRLPFVNKNFDISHGHPYSINAVNTTDPLWHDLHYGLSDIFSKKSIIPIMEKHKSILFGHQTVNLFLEEYFLKVWSEYCFGPVDYFEFKTLRDDLINVLRLVFHGNRLNRLPWIGRLTSIRNFQKYLPVLKNIDAGLQTLLESSIRNRDGAFFDLYEKLKLKYSNAFQITLDNSFLVILVYDFIYTVLLDTTASIAKNPQINRFMQVQKSMHDGFLYPFRFRTAEESFDDVHIGDYCIINLQKAGLYFSSGSRYCVGQSLFREIYQKFLEIYEDYEIKLINPDEEIIYNGSKDIPIMLSQHLVEITKKPGGNTKS